MKKWRAIWVVTALLLLALAVPVQAKPSAKKVRRAYKSYMRRYNGMSDSGREYYNLVDLNRDGVKECIVSGQRGQNERQIILTYMQGKIKKLYDQFGVRGFCYNAKKKQLCINLSYGINYKGTDFIYKFNGKKLKLVTSYTFKSRAGYGNGYNYYKGKKRISAKAYDKVMKMLNSWTQLPQGTSF